MDMEIENYVDMLIGFVGGISSWFFGGFDSLIKLLLAAIVIDYASGVFRSYMKHELCSDIGFRGIARKVMIFALVGLTHLIDKELPGGTEILRDAVIFFYLSNEGISILENAIELGLPVPEGLKSRLMKFRE